MSFQVFGIPVSRGVAIGRAVLVASSRVDVAHYFIDAASVESEIQRCMRARDEVAQELETLKRDLPDDAPHELAALLDVHLMLMHDEALTGATKQWIIERHYNAEWALSAQLEVLARQFDEMEDDYLRERKADLEQVVERILGVLARQQGKAGGAASVVQRDFAGEDPLLLVAADIAPADMMQFKRSVFHGFITDIGGKTSHTAIVARSMDIPAVVGTREASRLIRQDDWVIIDGDAGAVIVDPSPIVLEEYRFRQRQSELERARLARLRHTPAVTLDGERVELQANIELPADAPAAVEAGATGVGLFRSEFLFMNREGELPGEDEQFEAYRAAVEAMRGMPVTIRTVDIGADKPLDRMSASELRHEHVLNPAMGLRAIRWSLAEPSMFRQQLRAIYRASAYGKLRLLIPMVAHLGEIRQVLEAVKRVQQQLTDAGQAFTRVDIGVMIEIPAAAVMLPLLLRHVDFVSIGTNDLIQYTLAIDRADEAVAHLYDPWHPAVLQLISTSIAQATAAGKSVSVCGEMAGDAAFTDLLLAMGLRNFSMHPSQIPSVKQRILRADAARLAAALPEVLSSEDPQRAADLAFSASKLSHLMQ
ncbi:phosphoenolpyruvate--protein phosphotransferase [Paucibacter sp. O1-1]|uniref:phosphoenolpyruvate--protein phosphotransferase n=1 Tax=unclassified Roseateles TaxID=2626991 RepID=UPI0010F8DE74|nr:MULTISPECIES: phosphoenolpyruvate--protein phosphotransferase [unclassified Roseateles]MCU7370989.1 phosphoenolpyruvate--protein phosphotransferase [Paucibacter sp. O1-1]MCZ7881324.1 phosphoenolpyruvate--protein phosphotransferase [Paucibacter sp. M5-1]MDA3825977.1 phosphoenolpyruvate--protein phosphotransferase [Paucibacter sp. O1-1]MDC6167933.1 phosphoenolpyruvate--protein phosphotransferase [Paucibacter sp. XJ19-41]